MFETLSEYQFLFSYKKVSKIEKYCCIMDNEGSIIKQNKYFEIVLKFSQNFDKFK